MHASHFALLAALVVSACGDANGDTDVKLRPAQVVPSPSAPAPKLDLGPDRAEIRVNADKLADDRAKDAKKGDHQDAEWVAKEFSSGQARWKDTGVYLDGKPIGFLTWGELPIGLKPSWLKEKVSAEKRYGTDDPGWKWARKRYYKVTDYLKAVGVDIRAIKEVHIYGPKPSESLVLTSKDLQKPAADQLWFWFGSNTFGKPIPHAPANLGTGRSGDKINGIMIYKDKKPPTLVDNEGMFLDGVEQQGVPYYGEPIRGGVRVYVDDKLATIIKRQELDPKKAIKASDGEPQWLLRDFLADHGVDTKKIVEVWTVRNEKRSEKFSGPELATLSFEASSQSKGGVLLGDNHVLANVIALHSRALTPADMPLPEQDDE